MRIIFPKKATVFLEHFEQILLTAGLTSEGGSVDPPTDQHGFLTGKTLKSVQAMQARLGEGLDTKTHLTGEYKKAGLALQDAKGRLTLTVRNVWAIIRQRVSRGELPKNIFTMYGQMANGNNPVDQSMSMWPIYAKTLIQAEAEIAARGHEPTSAPSVADIRQALELYKERRTAKKNAGNLLTAYNQETFQHLELEAKRLYQLVMGELRLVLRDYDASERRQIMRNYGAEFVEVEAGEPETEPPVEGGGTTQEPPTAGEATPEAEVSAIDTKVSEPAA